MDFFITSAFVLGLFVVPGLINYYVNRYYTTSATAPAPTLDLVVASLTLTFVILVLDVAVVLLVSLGWDELREQIADFVQLGLLDYARERPIAVTSVLSAYSVSCMTLLALLGVFRIPSRFVR
ncbi:MAG: hypothetical protein IIA23_11650 [Chloroflexi bacterium]|nr:hypothetical protein [Chloroflexota bacterium]